MIGPSGSGPSPNCITAESGDVNPSEGGKRRILDELVGIDGFCDELCAHHHHHQEHPEQIDSSTSIKRPRIMLASQLDPSIMMLGDAANELRDMPSLQYSSSYLDTTQDDHQHQQQNQGFSEAFHQLEEPQQQLTAESLTRLEVLVVDHTNWHDAFEAIDVVEAASQPLTDLSQLTTCHQSINNQHHQSELQILDNVNFQNSYWSSSEPELHNPDPQPQEQQHHLNHHHHHHQHQQQQQQQQQQHQQHQYSVIPKAPSSGPVGTIRVRTHGLTANPIPVCEDQENGNLSWLLDFKLDSFIGANEDRTSHNSARESMAHKTKFINNHNNSGNRTSVYAHEIKRSCDSESRHSTNGFHGAADNRNRCTGPKKPPFTYTELIEHALQERGELTVSAIYQWISERFPYYKSNDDRWKNSVRHNLSINPHFRKGSKAPHGAGHLWAIASQDESKPRQLFNIASIRQAIRNEEANAARKKSRTVVIDEVATATASIAEPAEEENMSDEISLEHCAEQILSGIKREVEVQYLVPMMIPNNGTIINNQQQNATTDPLGSLKETDFLNPVSKEVVAEECGLMDEASYLVTDQNPTLLSLAESEIITADNLFGEELSFQFYEFTSSSQLQSA